MDISMYQVLKLRIKGTRNRTSSFLFFMALCIPIPLWQLTSYVHQDQLCRQRSSLPSFCLSITRVSALLPNGVMPHGENFCRLLAHSLYFLITDLLPVSALFPVDVICYILFDSVTLHVTVSYIVSFFFLSSLHIYARSFNVSQHFGRIILYTFCQHGIKDSNQFCCNCHQ